MDFKNWRARARSFSLTASSYSRHSLRALTQVRIFMAVRGRIRGEIGGMTRYLKEEIDEEKREAIVARDRSVQHRDEIKI